MTRFLKRLSVVIGIIIAAGYVSIFLSRAACEHAVAREVAGRYAEAGILVYTPANELGPWGYPGSLEILRRSGYPAQRCPSEAEENLRCVPGVGVAWGQTHYPYLIKVHWLRSGGQLATMTGHWWFLCLFGYVIPIADIGEGGS
jgi:hypothetical protein